MGVGRQRGTVYSEACQSVEIRQDFKHFLVLEEVYGFVNVFTICSKI